MKTPTLIVRLVGIYLLVNSIMTLIQIGRVTGTQAKAAGLKMPANAVLDDMQLYSWIGIGVGVVVIILAGILARLLTFDADGRSGSDDFSDRLLRR